MRNLWFVAFLFCGTFLGAQDADTTIYLVPEMKARFPACERFDTTIEAKYVCSQQALLAFVYKNVQYPLEARTNGNEGTVVVRFVIEKDSLLSNLEVLRDIGGGCGESVVNLFLAMNEANIKWVPAQVKGKNVRSSMTFPVKFKLEEAPPFVMVERDTVYTVVDSPLSFKGGNEELVKVLNERLVYPEALKDSCFIGNLDAQVLVRPDGVVKVLDLTDYNNLGFEFWSAASDAITSTFGQWEYAKYKERDVPSAVDVTVTFVPETDNCKTAVDTYQKAVDLFNEGTVLFNEGKQDEGIAKLSEAIELFPGDANFLLTRGQAYMDMKKYPEACADLTLGQQIALVNWFDGVLGIVCKLQEGGEE
ncbi:MAG: energy transducer TonB [Bacteroidota bacterium]